jgi:light-regulated signal transduction histidine kinase (bacteriophytochrome)
VSIYSELLAQKYKGKLDTEGDEYIDFVTEGAQQTVTLLKELREYWLVSDGVARFAPVDCEAVFEKVMRALRVPIRDSGASVTHEPLPTLQGDEVALGMLFQNLLGNAIKYRHKGEPPSVHVAVWKTANAWCFSIRDNGIGIQAEYLEEVFAPFKRLHGAAYPGTGLGLALCHKIVERYGGRIWVESIIGREATFYFTIPDKPGVVH